MTNMEDEVDKVRIFSDVISYNRFCKISHAQIVRPKFKVIAFYTAKKDKAHISLVHEANGQFPRMAKQYHFTYDSTNNRATLNPKFLANYQVVSFLDTRPEDTAQRRAFQDYMNNGGSWMGFHFSAFAVDNSTYPQNWNWYYNTFLGSGQYVSNTLRPTAAYLYV